jgi:hypothetical protein
LRTIHEPARELEVEVEADVIVAGGGPAGVGAALAAAREGARTVLFERFGMLGGMWTAALVNPLFQQQNGWLVAELVQRLEAAGGWQKQDWFWTFNPEVLKGVLEETLAEAGVDFRYFTWCAAPVMDEHRVTGVITESKAGRRAALASIVIDATGDGDVAAGAGAEVAFGRSSDGLVQPATLMFQLDGVEGNHHPRDLYPALQEALAALGSDWQLPFGQVNYAPWIIAVPNHPAVVQATHIYEYNPLDPKSLTGAMVEGRRQARKLSRAFQAIPGWEQARLVNTASALGIRESRRVRGLYSLCLEDLQRGATFPDAVASCSFCVDIHAPDGNSANTPHHAPIKPYEIPYRCLVPKGVDGLLVCGRCISGTHEAHASYRVTGTCMAMGQAVGLAAANAVQQTIAPREVDGVWLRRALGERGYTFLAG